MSLFPKTFMKRNICIFLSLVMISGLSIAQKRTLDHDDFTEISLGIPGTVYISQGTSHKVVVDCDDEIYDRIEIVKSGDRLSIRNESRSNRIGFRRSDLDIYVTIVDLEKLSLSGSGVIKSEGNIDVEDLRLIISGSGKIDLEVSGEEISIGISGSGEILLEGEADRGDINISGSGDLYAEDLNLNTFEATISGGGNCRVNVEKEITANISGSGDVYYSGNPDKVISNSSGSGKIRKN